MLTAAEAKERTFKTAQEMNQITQEAQEHSIMKCINTAAVQGFYVTTVDESSLPNRLKVKLNDLGYKLRFTKSICSETETGACTISWR